MCGDCGTQYYRVTWARNGKKKIVWRCINHLEYGTKYCKSSPTIEEYKLQDAIVKAIASFAADKDELIATLKNSLRIALTTDEDVIDTIAIENKIKELNDVMLDLVQKMSGQAPARITSMTNSKKYPMKSRNCRIP